MRDDPSYPNAPRATTFSDGIEFQDWVCELMAREHIILQNLSSKKYQFERGENLQGFEIKLDARCTETGRLSIEVAEKSRASNPRWIPSGIMREDNAWLYIQGNRTQLWIFARNHLRLYREKKRPQEHDSYGTVRKFYLTIALANRMAAKIVVP